MAILWLNRSHRSQRCPRASGWLWWYRFVCAVSVAPRRDRTRNLSRHWTRPKQIQKQRINCVSLILISKSGQSISMSKKGRPHGSNFRHKWVSTVLNLRTFCRDLSKRTDVKLKSNRTKPFWISTLPCEIAAYIAIHTFGIRMIYPGSLKLIQSFLHPVLVQGRAKLVEEEHAKRYKLRTIDNNDVDTIFVDNRNAAGGNINGKTLVICSEGNAGFYEIGIMTTPLSLKYSVLGWNHPGFGGSTVRMPFDQ